MAEDKKEQAKRKASENGIINPSGAMLMGAAPMYLALVPVTTYFTKPDSVCQSLVHALIKLLPGVTAASITSGRAIPALSALYLFWTFGASGALSAAGQAMGRTEGLDNDHPRKHIHELDGLPLRLRSAHYALMENFPAFALAAALSQVLAPNDAQIVNLLGFHVMAKLMVHYPAYLGNVAVPRSVAHLSATAALVNVCWRLADAS
ncbi:membrane protein [Stemphylium lycopersici]|uniref:Membrane protein n=1 Tax=Stemphylium lycopersici TaxID=183478 RepID=A0A364MS52_STELY|nr:membrane protein [Stemphylium lycopersici]RAR01572.1 membrane protein [Stemphylium lycopersici]RAR02335.1 membrane protein [Stemphylium lycopersici]